MKLLFFITLLIISLTIVNSNKEQIVIENKNNFEVSKPIQKKKISSIHGGSEDDDDLNSSRTVEWYSCSSADSVLIIDELILTPDPPKRGSKVKIELYGFLLRDIEVGSRIKLSIKYGSLLVYKDDMDLCSLVSCPMKRGEVYATYEANIYSYIPKGTYKADAYAWEPDKQEIACAYGKVQLV